MFKKAVIRIKIFYYENVYRAYEKEETKYKEKALNYIVKNQKKYIRYKLKANEAYFMRQHIDHKLLYLYQSERS